MPSGHLAQMECDGTKGIAAANSAPYWPLRPPFASSPWSEDRFSGFSYGLGPNGRLANPQHWQWKKKGNSEQMFYRLQKIFIYDRYGFLEITIQSLFVFSLAPEKNWNYLYQNRKQLRMYLDSRFILNRREGLKNKENLRKIGNVHFYSIHRYNQVCWRD